MGRDCILGREGRWRRVVDMSTSYVDFVDNPKERKLLVLLPFNFNIF